MKSNFKKYCFIAYLSFLFVFSEVAAHEPNHSYIFLRIYENSISGRFEVARTELNQILEIELSENLLPTEINPHKDAIQSYLLSNIEFGSNLGQYKITVNEIAPLNIDEEDDNVFVSFKLEMPDGIPDFLEITYEPFFEQNPNHKGVLIIEYHWKAGIIDNHTLVADVFTSKESIKQLDLQDVSIWKGFVAMVKLGVWHIWIGIDHILFLIALVLPAVVRRKTDHHQVETLNYSIENEWNPVARFKPAAWYIIKIVTFFTIAHSLTLAIASLGWFSLPSRYVESVIAFSIALAAFHNIRPIFKSREWVVAFAFGLFHGFGFASVLGEKGLGGDYFLLSLFGFNGGVEIGQVAIILVVFPILFLIRTNNSYPNLLKYGSGLLILISLHWSIERLFEVNIPISRWVGSLFTYIQPMIGF